MSNKTIKQIKVVEASNGARFQDLYNQTAEELADCDVEIEIEHKASGHCAYFMYTMNIPEKMSLGEALNQYGISHKCSECPLMEIGSDARRKKWYCARKEKFLHMDNEMCDYAYEKLLAGMLKLRKELDDEEDD